MPSVLAIKGGPGKREVRAALARVLASQPLRSAPRLQSLLTFLVEEVLAGRGQSLVQYRVATEGLGLGEDFDPEKHTLVRSHAGRLRKALAAYYEGEGRADKIVIALPASGYRVDFVRVGARAVRAAKAPGLAPLLVVSRFQGIGLKASWGALPASVAEELSLRLARAAHLRVAQGEHAARRPDADFVLEGSIEQRGGKLLVRSRLLDAPGGVQIWNRRYEWSQLRWDADAFEEEIVEAIAVEVGSDFGRIDRHLLRRPASGAEAGGSLPFALLKAKAYEASYSEDAYREAVAALSAALRESPADATTNAVMSAILLAGHCEYFRKRAVFPVEASEYIAIARAVEPNNPYLLYAQVVELLVRRQYGALKGFSARVLSNAEFPAGLALLVCLYRLYSRTATPKTGEKVARLMRLNPDYPRLVHTGFALEHLLAGDHEAAQRDADAAYLPDYWFSPVLQIAIHHAAGRKREAQAARVRLLALCPDFGRHGKEVLARSLHADFVTLLMKAYRAAV